MSQEDRDNIDERAANLEMLYERAPSLQKIAFLESQTVEFPVLLHICRYSGGSLRFKAWASKQAFAQAHSLADYVALNRAFSSNNALQKRACEGILQFEITSDEDIALLRRGDKRLRNIAWYLAGRKNLELS